MFEADFFKFKQKWINFDLDENNWKALMNEADVLMKKYCNMNEQIAYYSFQNLATFIDFMDRKTKGDYGSEYMRKGLLEM